ncbi:MAG: hypothetical protein LBG15_16000 [Dysgonamonadaceae bacterium]|jgi:uncharacterized membrane-anchored protein YhcB (DUF1043 family)|nr:hypothetical protein [Dysgonamonadaceae bacterium]
MKKIIIPFLILFIAQTTFAQTDTVVITSDSLVIQQLQQNVKQLRTDLRRQRTDFSKRLSVANENIENLQSQIDTQQQTISALADSLGVKISDTQTNATQQVQSVQEKVNKNTLYWIIAVSAIALFSALLFFLLYKKQKKNRTDIIGQLEKTKSSVEEQLVKEFAKQAEVMESLLKTLRELPVTTTGGEPDHSLALKLADEITLMERNISLMDSNTKGLKQLNRSIGKLKDNLAANSYEIPELLGKPYNEGMKATITNTIQDENLAKGVEQITKIVKPQVNYQDKMIQAAQIEVSVG